jgi:prepilin-type N-terminal cleavage/methylation domain-containing protein
MKKHTTLKSKFNSAFSLVELLVVIAVIAVIAAIAIPNITGAREAAVQAQGDYNSAARERFLNTINAQGAGAAIGDITNGYSWVNTNVTPNITNSFTE